MDDYTHTPVTVADERAIVVGGTSGLGQAIAVGFAAGGAFEEDAIVTDSLEYSLSPDSGRNIETDASLGLGIRPEDVHVGDRQSTDQGLEAEVVVVEPMGNENIIHLRFDGMTVGDEFIVTAEGVPNVGTGDQVGVEFPEAAIHLFDGDSGVAITNRELSFTGTRDEVLP